MTVRLTNARKREDVMAEQRLLVNEIQALINSAKALVCLAKSIHAGTAEVFEAYEMDAQDSLREASAFQSMLDDKQAQIDDLAGTLVELEEDDCCGAYDAADFGAPKVGAL